MIAPFSAMELDHIRRLQSEGLALTDIAIRLDRPRREVEVAIWTRLGRSADEAARFLASASPMTTRMNPFQRFMGRMFG